MTAVPVPTFGPKGFIAPTEAAILAGVLADIQAAFGGGLNLSLETPQGQLASSMAAIIGNCYDTFVKMANDVDPSYADGRYQDAIARIYFIERKPSVPTVVEATLTGLAGTLVPAGSFAQAADGNVYTSTQDGTIGINGTVNVSFQCNVAGAIACPAGNLNTIYQSVLGWESITNQTDGVIGQEVESRADFEARRFASVAHNSLGFLPSVLGTLLSVADVVDAYVTENFTGSPVTVGGYTLAAHSLYAAVVGGAAADVAKALWSKKAPGCNYNGNTTVTVYDDTSGYDNPLPSYAVKFEIPDALSVLFDVNIVTTNNPLVPADAATQIQNAIISAFSGGDGGPRARIGSTIYASRFYAPIAALGPWVQIVSVDIGSANTPSASIVGSISGTTLTVTSCTSPTIAALQFLSGSGAGSAVAIGTQIVSQLSGSAGGTGTYQLSITQVVPSISMKTAVANQNSVAVQIDQVPTVSALEIVVDTT